MLIQQNMHRRERNQAKSDIYREISDKIECCKLKASAFGPNINFTDPHYNARSANRKKRWYRRLNLHRQPWDQEHTHCEKRREKNRWSKRLNALGLLLYINTKTHGETQKTTRKYVWKNAGIKIQTQERTTDSPGRRTTERRGRKATERRGQGRKASRGGRSPLVITFGQAEMKLAARGSRAGPSLLLPVLSVDRSRTWVSDGERWGGKRQEDLFKQQGVHRDKLLVWASQACCYLLVLVGWRSIMLVAQEIYYNYGYLQVFMFWVM